MQEAVLNRVYHQVVDYQDATTEYFLYQPSLVRNTSTVTHISICGLANSLELVIPTSGNEDPSDDPNGDGGIDDTDERKDDGVFRPFFHLRSITFWCFQKLLEMKVEAEREGWEVVQWRQSWSLY